MQFKLRVRLIGELAILTLMLCFATVSRAQSQGGKSAERSICHLTGNAMSPFELITVRSGAKASHLGHGDVEAENGKCPSVLPMSWSSGSRGNGVAASPNRGAAASALNSASGGTQSDPVTAVAAAEEEKKTAICHREGDGTYHLNTVSSSAVDAHLAHGDAYPEDGACLNGTTGGDVEPGATPEPITMLLFGAGLAGVGYLTRRRLSTGSEAI